MNDNFRVCQLAKTFVEYLEGRTIDINEAQKRLQRRSKSRSIHHQKNSELSPYRAYIINSYYNDYLNRTNHDINILVHLNLVEMEVNVTGLNFSQVFDAIKRDKGNFYFVLGINTCCFSGFAILFGASYFVIFYVKEKTTLFRFVQTIAGLNAGIYWLVAALFDCIIFWSTILVFLVTLYVLQLELYQTQEELIDLIFLL